MRWVIFLNSLYHSSCNRRLLWSIRSMFLISKKIKVTVHTCMKIQRKGLCNLQPPDFSLSTFFNSYTCRIDRGPPIFSPSATSSLCICVQFSVILFFVIKNVCFYFVVWLIIFFAGFNGVHLWIHFIPLEIQSTLDGVHLWIHLFWSDLNRLIIHKGQW